MIPTHALHTKYSEQRTFYDNFKGRKCSYILFRDRFKKGIPLEKAISHICLKIKSSRLSETGRDCTKCKQFKHWQSFSKMSTGLNGRSTDCLDCRNIKHRKERENKALREKENEYKRLRRSSEQGKLRTFLDNLYYQDPVILNKRSILKSVDGKIEKKESLKSKIDYLVNRGYDSELLEKIYNTVTEYKGKIMADTRY